MQVLELLKGDVEMLKWAKLQVSNPLEDSMLLKDEKLRRSNLQSHLNLAFLDMEDDSLSMGSMEQGISVEEYLKGRTSRSSSFNWAIIFVHYNKSQLQYSTMWDGEKKEFSCVWVSVKCIFKKMCFFSLSWSHGWWMRGGFVWVLLPSSLPWFRGYSYSVQRFRVFYAMFFTWEHQRHVICIPWS